jgi:hypothetical protein
MITLTTVEAFLDRPPRARAIGSPSSITAPPLARCLTGFAERPGFVTPPPS